MNRVKVEFKRLLVVLASEESTDLELIEKKIDWRNSGKASKRVDRSRVVFQVEMFST